MSTSDTKLRKKLADKEYRDAFVAAQISVGLPFQIRALRAKKKLSQKELCQKTGMLQPRISVIETPGGSSLTLATLQKIASAFDVALIVRFAPFGDLVQFSEEFDADNFDVASYPDDPGLNVVSDVAPQAVRGTKVIWMDKWRRSGGQRGTPSGRTSASANRVAVTPQPIQNGASTTALMQAGGVHG